MLKRLGIADASVIADFQIISALTYTYSLSNYRYNIQAACQKFISKRYLDMLSTPSFSHVVKKLALDTYNPFLCQLRVQCMFPNGPFSGPFL